MTITGRSIKIVIDRLGRPVVEAVGFNGQGCTDATKAIEQALAGGDGGVERVLKPEWTNSEDAENTETEGMSW